MGEDIKITNELLFKEAISLVEGNNFDEAIKYCDDMIRNDESDIDAWNIKSICCFAKNDFLEALKCIEKVIKLDPNDKMAKICKNNCLLILENDEIMEILKNLENLHKNGILTLEEYRAMRKLAIGEVYKQKY